MKHFERAWHFFLAEPFLWLFYYYVQPSNFDAHVETNRVGKRAVRMSRLALPIFLIAYVLLLLIAYFGGSHVNILAVLPGFVGGIALGTTRSIKSGIAGSLGFGIGLGLGFDALPQVLAHPSSLSVSSIGMGLGIGLAIGLGTYGDFLGQSARRILGGIERGIIGSGWELLKACLRCVLLGVIGGVGGLMITFLVVVIVTGGGETINSTAETIIRGGVTIGAIIGCLLGFARRGIRRRSKSFSSRIARAMLYSLVFGILGAIVGGITWHLTGGQEELISLGTTGGNALNAFFSSGSQPPPSGVPVAPPESPAMQAFIALCGALGVLIGTEVGILLGVADTILTGLVVPNVRKRISAGLNIGLRRGFESGVFLGIVWSILVTLASALIMGIAEITFVNGLGAGFILALLYIIVYYRLPVYLISSLSQLWVNYKISRDPKMVFTSLHHSSLYWDESGSIPLPFLSETLLKAFAQDVDQTLREMSFIIEKRPSQIRVVRKCLTEIFMSYLGKPRTLHDIAKVPDLLDRFLPLGTKVFVPRWGDRFALMNDAGFDARRYYDWDDWQIKHDALQGMLFHLRSLNLKKIKPGDAVTNEDRLNIRLRAVVDWWVSVAQIETARLEQESPSTAILDNPYKPGPPLKRGDRLFVGRMNLAKQLMQAFGSTGSRPTISLEGERRMGKSSLLEQLPILLSAQYLSVYVSLQTTGLLSSAAAFLSTIAEKIDTAMQERGLQVKPLNEMHLHQINQDNEAATYHFFGKWLKSIERTLGQRNHLLLLALDEFETLGDEQTTEFLNLPFLLNWLRSVTQDYTHVALLFSGVHNLNDLVTKTGTNWGNYFVHVQTLKVSFLQPQEAHQLIVQPVPNFPGEQVFSEEVIEAIIKETGCQPFLVQAVCNELIKLLNEKNRRRAELQDISGAVDKVFTAWDPGYFQYLWKTMDPHHRACLEALQELGEGDLYTITKVCGLNEQVVHQALQTLSKKRDIVLQQNGIYRIAVPIFGTWIERRIHHPQN